MTEQHDVDEGGQLPEEDLAREAEDHGAGVDRSDGDGQGDQGHHAGLALADLVAPARSGRASRRKRRRRWPAPGKPSRTPRRAPAEPEEALDQRREGEDGHGQGQRDPEAAAKIGDHRPMIMPAGHGMAGGGAMAGGGHAGRVTGVLVMPSARSSWVVLARWLPRNRLCRREGEWPVDCRDARSQTTVPLLVMLGLVPSIHVLGRQSPEGRAEKESQTRQLRALCRSSHEVSGRKAWMLGTSPSMTRIVAAGRDPVSRQST